MHKTFLPIWLKRAAPFLTKLSIYVYTVLYNAKHIEEYLFREKKKTFRPPHR